MSSIDPKAPKEFTDALSDVFGMPVPAELADRFPISMSVTALEHTIYVMESHLQRIARERDALLRILKPLVPPGLIEAALADARIGN